MVIMKRSKMYIPKLQVYTLDSDFTISSAYWRGKSSTPEACLEDHRLEIANMSFQVRTDG